MATRYGLANSTRLLSVRFLFGDDDAPCRVDHALCLRGVSRRIKQRVAARDFGDDLGERLDEDGREDRRGAHEHRGA